MKPNKKKSAVLDRGHIAVARALNLPFSSKHGMEISRALRYKNTTFAKQFLEEVIVLKRAVPFTRHFHNVGHKPGMSSGRYPIKAAKEFLHLVKSVEANAQSKGLNVSALKITKIIANKASVPFTGGRFRRATKRTHLEIEVRELSTGKKVEKNVKKIEELKSKSNTAVSAAVAATAPVHSTPAGPIHHTYTPATKKVASTAAGSKPVPETSPQELLQRAQKRAAELNSQKENQVKSQEVSNLYEELKKKGTLRGKEGDKK